MELIGKLVNFEIDDEGCFIWQGNKDNDGYGRININKKSKLAHRIAYATLVEEIPLGLHVLHTCDKRPCINPDHLFLGTQVDNIQDMVNKGRQKSGMRRKFSDELIREIREDYKSGDYTMEQIAGECGVDIKTIWCIVKYKTYKDIE